ncbi:tpaE [Nocardiopsis sp. RSe5-2]|uniref:TpaE n=1 Tax=Nocardiopsis endophytica TaxID=3018445 RepID=A0ABT4TZT9_9ACTN|nr:tpaE [Nocardiopsis endophytica]MDA2810219.1 tpaE [Nocardiopsis endophytica]
MGAELRGDTLGRVARRDKQIEVPVRPVLRKGVRLRRSGDTVMLDGAEKRQAFTGRFARERLAGLAAACDGTATHAEIAAALGLDESVVYKSLAMLWASGALEEGDRDGPPPEVPSELACLMSRLGGSTGVNPSWTDAAARLGRTVVAVAGDGGLAEATAACLDGVCEVVRDADRPPEAEGALVVFFETRSSRPALAAIRDRCRTEGRALLRVRADGASMTLGPYVDPAFTPCLECGASGEDEPEDDPPARSTELIAGLAAHHVLALVSRAVRTFLPLDSATVDLATLATRYRPSAVRPGCPTCSFSEGPVAPEPTSSALYEAAVALPPRGFLDTAGHLAHFQSSNVELQWRFRTWPGCPRVELPEADTSRLAGAPSAGGDRTGLGRPELALLLAIAFGVRERTEGWVQRWTAAGGNIGSATAYLISRDEDVLPVGGYAYRDGDHSLARVADGGPPGGPGPGAPVTLVATANLKKMAAKYGTFGYRLSLCDAGCALASARRVADRLGLEVSLAADWDDGLLSGYLGLNPSEEPVAAVMEVG